MGNSNPITGMVFMPPSPSSYTETRPREVEYIVTPKHKKRIPIYYLPVNDRFLEKKLDVEEEEDGEKRKKKTVKTTILYSHGNATDIGLMNDFLILLHENLPVNILHYEYVGYGLATRDCNPSEELTYDSIEAAYRYLILEKELSPKDIILWGTSLGGGPTVELASKGVEFRGVILECAFTSCCRVVEMVKKNNILSNVLEKTVDMFVNISKIDRVRSPAIMIHGRDDTVVPFAHGKDLWSKMNEGCKYKRIWVDDADHHDIITTMTTREYICEIRDFLKHCRKVQERGGLNLPVLKKKKKKKGNWLTCSAGDLDDDIFDLASESPISASAGVPQFDDDKKETKKEDEKEVKKEEVAEEKKKEEEDTPGEEKEEVEGEKE